MLTLRVTLGASASVFALMLMSSVALANGASIDASIGEDSLIACEDYPVVGDVETLEEALPEQLKGDCAEGGCPLLVAEYPESVPVELADIDPVIYQNEAVNPPVSHRSSSDSTSANANTIPNLCDTAGPGWNWLCAAN